MCQGCRALYVRETSWHLHTQVSDHLGILALTGKKWKCPPTAILSHHADTGTPTSFDDFRIVSSSYSESKLLLWESLLISKLKPSSNANMSSAPVVFYLYTVCVIFIFILSFYWLLHVLAFACHYIVSITVQWVPV